MQIRVLRIVPWHCGHFVNKGFIQTLGTRLLRSNWEYAELTSPIPVSVCRLRSKRTSYREGELHCHIYDDGSAIFSIIDQPLELESIDDIDPIEYNMRKAIWNRDILNGSHRSSELIKELRSLFLEIRRERVSSQELLYYPEFENNGYVFTIFLVSFSVDEQRPSGINLFVDEMLRPSGAAILAQSERAAQYDITLTLSTHSVTKRIILPVVLNPLAEIYCSWASIVIVGDQDNRAFDLLWRLQRGVQRCWHLADQMERVLTTAITNSSQGSSLKEIQRIHRMCAQLALSVERFRGVPKGMSSEAEIELYDTLRASSRLDAMYERVERLRCILQERYHSELENRRNGIESALGFAIYLLTIIIGWDAFRRLRTEATISTGEIAFVASLALLGAFLYVLRER